MGLQSKAEVSCLGVCVDECGLCTDKAWYTWESDQGGVRERTKLRVVRVGSLTLTQRRTL
jgi:hypothetical protein